MSDISASDAPVADAAPEAAFDLDAAVEEFATNAPDEWKGKASKIQSELKNLRGKYTPYRDRFEALHENDREAIYQFTDLARSGDREGAMKWAIEAAKGLAGDKWNDIVKGLTPAEQAEVAAEAIEDAGEAGNLGPEDIQRMVQEAIKADREERAQQEQAIQRRAQIDDDFRSLGYDVTRTEDGRLADFTTQQVAMLAINDHKGDLKAAHEAYQKWLGDAAKSFLQKHQGDGSLLAEGGVPTGSGEQDVSKMTPKERAMARMKRLAEGAEM